MFVLVWLVVCVLGCVFASLACWLCGWFGVRFVVELCTCVVGCVLMCGGCVM